MPKHTTSLFINALEVQVYLGWTNKERLKKQTVYLDVAISFHHMPKACHTDHLDDTFCYKDLINIIRKKIASIKFNLIEHLTCEIHKIIKDALPFKTKLDVSITKHPKIKGLNGGVSFHYGDI